MTDAIDRCVRALNNWCRTNADGGQIPPRMLERVAVYLMYGEPPEPAGFLEALICDLPFSRVVPLADDENRFALMTWHRLIHNIFPMPAWKSAENMAAWVAGGGTGGQAIPYLDRYA